MKMNWKHAYLRKATEEEAKEYPSFNWVSLKEEMP